MNALNKTEIISFLGKRGDVVTYPGGDCALCERYFSDVQTMYVSVGGKTSAKAQVCSDCILKHLGV